VSDSRIQSITLEPGNATRYDLDISYVGTDLFVILYRDRQRRGGVCMKFAASTATTVTYRPTEVARTMGCHFTEAAIILAHLRREYDIYAELETTFDQETGVWTGPTLH